MITLKRLNTHIQKKYPQLELQKNFNYYYVYGRNEETALKLASLATTNTLHQNLNKLSLEQWVERIELILRDYNRSHLDRCPVTF